MEAQTENFWEGVPIQTVMMSAEGHFTFDKGQWYKAIGCNKETGAIVFSKVNSEDVPETIKRQYGS